MADQLRALEIGAVAAGVPTRVPRLMVHRAASILRQLLDAGTPIEDPRCQSLLQLVNSARHILVPTPHDVVHNHNNATAMAVEFDVASASMAAIMGLQNASSLTGAAMAEVAALNGRPAKLVTSSSAINSHPDVHTRKRIKLLPKPSQKATEAIFDLVRNDAALGNRAHQEAVNRSSSMASKMHKLRAGQRHASVRKRRLLGEVNPDIPTDRLGDLTAPYNGAPLINLSGTPGMNTFTPPSLPRTRRLVYSSPAPVHNENIPSSPPRSPSPESQEMLQDETKEVTSPAQPPVAKQFVAPNLQPQTHRPVKNLNPREKGVMNDTVGTPVDVMKAFMHPQQSVYMTLDDKLDNPSKIRSVLAERERILYRLLKRRQAELGAMPLGMSEQTRRKAIIEAKQLSLIDLQRVARYRVCAEFKKICSLTIQEDGYVPSDNLSRLFRRRDPPIYSYTDGYPRITPFDGVSEIPPRPMHVVSQDSLRMAQFDKSRMDSQKAARRSNFHSNLLAHYEGFQQFVIHSRNCRARVSKGFERYFLEKARAEEKRRKQERIERLRLLRSNDEKAYFDLLQTTKNERLLQLVRQTDNYLMQIGAQVEKAREQDSADPASSAHNTFSEELNEAGQVPISAMRRRRDLYYTVTHVVQEEVRQPSIMVHGTLKAYQIEGLKWMVSLYNNNLNGILADEMGLGKTIQTISLITYLVETKKNPGPYLVIVPLSTMGNWVRELDLWAPSLVKVVYRGDKNTRKHIQQTMLAHGEFNVLLTTYEFTVKDQNVLSRISWQYIIIDEGHRMKNANCKLAMTLGVRYRSRNRLLLTGTPLQNNLTELWALLNFLLPTIFSSADTFETWFKQPFESTALGDSAELEEEETLLVINRLHQVLRPFLLRRLKTDVESQLPQKVEHVIRCDMSAWQRVLYRQVRSRIGLATGANNQSVRAYNNLLMQCKKICNHPYIFYDVDAILDLPPDHLIRASGKFFLLQHMLPKLRRHGHRTLIFSQMTAALDYLEDFLVAIGIRYMRLDGTTKADNRQELLNTFNAKDSPYFCFLLSTRAGGLGLNLQTADTVIIFDSDWNPMMDLQAQDRAHRIGQTKVVRVYRLISSGTVEVKILEQANRKLQVDAQVIQAGQFNNKSTEMDRHQMLKDILRQKNEDEDALGDVPDMEELNRLIARSEEEFKDFCKFDEESVENSSFKPLLSAESELPEWVLRPDIDHKTAMEKEKEVMLSHGRGRRQRKVTRDLDLLSEAKWLQVMEGDLTIEEAFAGREKKRLSNAAATKNGQQIDGEKGEERGSSADGESDKEAWPEDDDGEEMENENDVEGAGAQDVDVKEVSEEMSEAEAAVSKSPERYKALQSKKETGFIQMKSTKEQGLTTADGAKVEGQRENDGNDQAGGRSQIGKSSEGKRKRKRTRKSMEGKKVELQGGDKIGAEETKMKSVSGAKEEVKSSRSNDGRSIRIRIPSSVMKDSGRKRQRVEAGEDSKTKEAEHESVKCKVRIRASTENVQGKRRSKAGKGGRIGKRGISNANEEWQKEQQANKKKGRSGKHKYDSIVNDILHGGSASSVSIDGLHATPKASPKDIKTAVGKEKSEVRKSMRARRVSKKAGDGRKVEDLHDLGESEDVDESGVDTGVMRDVSRPSVQVRLRVRKE